MGWVKSIGIAVAVLVIAAVGGLGCGGGGGGAVDLSDVEEVVAGALRVIAPPGKVGHLKTVQEPPEVEEARVQEFWVDADNGRSRSESRPAEGEEGWFNVTVGEDWRMATYQSDVEFFPIHITAVDREEAAARGIDNFAYYGAGCLGFLAWADERRLVGESAVEGRPVVLVEARWFWEPGGDWPEGVTLVTTVALDRSSLLPVQVQQNMVEPNGEEHPYGPLKCEIVEYVSPDDLPADFFSPDALFALYSPVHEKLAEASKLDFDLYWLGEKYEGAAQGQLDLYLWRVEMERVSWPELRYASETMDGGAEVVTIRQGPAGRAQFGPPPEMAGPIEQEEVTVQGQPATLYLKTDRLSPTYELTYQWLVFTLGETTIEIYPTPMSKEGQEVNPLNNKEAIVALAEGLVPVPAQP